jgi:putative ABC transport system ATP-binding protein
MKGILSMINLDRVTKNFLVGSESIQILKEVSLKIDNQEYVSILGPSGSGKSTLMYILGMLDTPSTGKYIINDRDTSTLSDDDISKLRNELEGFVFQQFNLINKLTVLENILLPSIYYNGVLNFDVKEKAKELMKRFGIDHRAQSYPNKISGGILTIYQV